MGEKAPPLLQVPCDKKALIFDHSQALSLALESVLVEEGFEVEVCDQPSQAMDACRENWFSFVFCEEYNANSIAFFNELRRSESYRDSVLVAMIEEEDERALALLEQGADLILRKPVGANALQLLLASGLKLLRERIHRTKAEQKLKDREQSLIEMMELLPDIVYQVDLKGRFVYVNHAVKKLGYRKEDLVGQHFSILFDEEMLKQISRDYVLGLIEIQGSLPTTPPKLFDERRRGGRRTSNLKVHLRHRKGDIVTSVLSSFGDVSGQGLYQRNVYKRALEVIGSIGVIQEIKPEMPMDDDLCVAKASLGAARSSELGGLGVSDEAIQEMDIFSYRIAHDIKNPLAFCRSMIELCEMGNISKDMCIPKVKVSLSRAISMLEGLYQLGRLQNMSLKWVEADLNEVVEEVCQWFKNQVDQNKIEVTLDCRHRVKVINEAFPLIISNLLSNAIKYASKQKPKIIIRGEVKNNFVWVIVEDNGQGLPPTIEETIFKAFSQLESSHVNGGLGIGMNTVKKALSLHRSQVEIGRSESLGGASFSFRLPMAEAPIFERE